MSAEHSSGTSTSPETKTTQYHPRSVLPVWVDREVNGFIQRDLSPEVRLHINDASELVLFDK